MRSIQDAIYGPVVSWRFGYSLGIDATLLPKKCTMSCIYCQLGSTKHYVEYGETLPENMAYLEPEELDTILETYLKDIDTSQLDIITFSGSGEPTLNTNLAELVDVVRRHIPGKPVGILTNGSLLHYPVVQKTLHTFDMVTLKLDCADQYCYQYINHPQSSIPLIDQQIQLYSEFKETYGGILAVEIMALQYHQWTNITDTQADHLIDALLLIKPDIIQLEQPYRPTTRSSVKLPPSKPIQVFTSRLKQYFSDEQLWIYGKYHKPQGKQLWNIPPTRHRILTITQHRPCSSNDLAIIFGVAEDQMKQMLSNMVDTDQLRTTLHQNITYYQST